MQNGQQTSISHQLNKVNAFKPTPPPPTIKIKQTTNKMFSETLDNLTYLSLGLPLLQRQAYILKEK